MLSANPNVDSKKQYDEKDLLLQVALGDEPAFHHLFDQYKQKIYSFSYYLTRSEAMAEEITQEVFIKIWIHRERLQEINYFTSWLKTIVRNHAYNYLLRIANEKLNLQKAASGIEYEACVTETDVLGREYDKLLDQAISQLSPQQKKVYLLSRKEGLKHKTIADEMGITVNTVKNHMKAALNAIRSYLETHTELMVLVALTLFFRE